MGPYTESKRTITTDSFFTCLSLSTNLIAKKTAIVDTIRRNKRERNQLNLKKDYIPRFSINFYKPRKEVLILNIKDKSVKIEKDGIRLPKTVVFYKIIKCSVNIAQIKWL